MKLFVFQQMKVLLEYFFKCKLKFKLTKKTTKIRGHPAEDFRHTDFRKHKYFFSWLCVCYCALNGSIVCILYCNILYQSMCFI